MGKQLLLLLLIILTIGCENTITGYSYNNYQSSTETSNDFSSHEVILIDHIIPTFTNYVIGSTETTALHGYITNVGDTTVTATFTISASFYTDSTFSVLCAQPNTVTFLNSIDPGGSKEFHMFDEGICNDYGSFVVGNFRVRKTILLD